MVSANYLPFSKITRKGKEKKILHLSHCFYRKLHLICQFYADTCLPSQFHTLVSHFTQVMTLASLGLDTDLDHFTDIHRKTLKFN